MDDQYSRYSAHKNNSPTRRPPLHQRTESESNSHVVAAIRLVPKTPPRLLGDSGAGKDLHPPPLPTFLGLGPPGTATPGPGERGSAALDNEFHSTKAQKQSNNIANFAAGTGSALSSPHTARQQSFRSAHSATPSTRSASPTSSTRSRPKPRKKRLHVHHDNKTFSLLQDDAALPPDEAFQSPDLSFSSTKASSSFLLSDDTQSSQGWDNLKTSCVSTRDIRDLTGSTYSIPSTPASKDQVPISADPIVSNSPWNYQFVGGLRKVAKTPNLKQKASSTVKQEQTPSLPRTSRDPPTVSHDLSTKPSFRSTNTEASERTNYKIYRGRSASPTNSLLPSSPSNSNYQLHRDPSPASSVIYRPQTAESETQNYEVYESSSPAAGPYLDLVRQPKYSQESLIVPPLNPKARRPNDNSGHRKPRSKESLLRSPSITSISTILSHKEALRAIVGRGSQIQLPIPIPKIRTTGTSSWAESSILYPPRSHMNEHPHQWSSQLSTVLSVSDSGTDRNSRSWSDDNGRVSSNFDSRSSGRASRGRILSMSSEQEPVSPLSRSQSGEPSSGVSRGDSFRAISRDSLTEPPQPYFSRHPRHHSSSSIRMVQDLDEHGDGITDMQDLRARPSRRHISGYFSSASSDNGRTNTMRSTTSTRANSLLASSIPAWARLYYGSGERRYLGAPGTSTGGTNTRASSFRSGSPNTENFPSNIYSPRRRPREFNPNRRDRRGSLDINPAPPLFGEDGRLINDPYSRRFRTWSMSSIWSPHLRHDRRTHGRSVWEPPSVNWSTGGGVFGRRNIQIVMFTIGFIFPFAWMIAAFLPLPPSPIHDMQERDRSTNNLDARNTTRSHLDRQFGPMDEARYESAVWWRKLNRWMSFVGVLIIASVVVLVVIGVKENWGMPRNSI